MTAVSAVEKALTTGLLHDGDLKRVQKGREMAE
jgi:hypothetical protein